MIFRQKIFNYSLILLLATFLLGCGDLRNFGIAQTNENNSISITEIKENNTGATVSFKGKVVKVAPFLGKGAYQIQDDTGNIWVLTEATLPQLGTEILVQGEIQYESIPIENQNLGEIYVVELKKVNVQQTDSQVPKNQVDGNSLETTNSQVSNNDSNTPSQESTNSNPVNNDFKQSIDDLFLPHKHLTKQDKTQLKNPNPRRDDLTIPLQKLEVLEF